MNPRIIKLGVESGMLNYVDHETPRHYFLSGHADEECFERFAEMIVRDCAGLCSITAPGRDADDIEEAIRKHFGVES